MAGLINKMKDALHSDKDNTSTDSTGTGHDTHRKLSILEV